MRSKQLGAWARLLCAAIALALLALPQYGVAAGTVRYAKAGGLMTGLCTTWLTACKLQRALSVASAGDQIWAKEGTYKPTTGTDRTKSFRLKSGVAVYGGFRGTETALTQRSWRGYPTVLSGDLGTPYPDVSGDSYHVVDASGVDSQSVLDGFIIMRGNADGSSPNDYGGGIYNSAGNAVLRNLTIEYNLASLGAGLYNYNGRPTLSNVTFYLNAAANGGGMSNISYMSLPMLTDVSFDNNSATASGGGIYIDSAAATLRNATFNSNTAANGGAIYGTDFGTTAITNATFYNNYATQYGGALFIAESSPVLKNLTFTANTATLNGGALYNTSSSGTPSVYSSIFWGDTSTEIFNALGSLSMTITNSVVQGGCPAVGATCSAIITSDPVLGTLRSNGGPTRTMALGAGSSAIDAGDPATCPGADQRRVSRPQGLACDAGAYEVRVMKFSSQAAYDGWMVESTAASVDATGTIARVGDTTSNKQSRAFFSFNTAGLPDTARVVKTTLRVNSAGQSGPLTGLNYLAIDMAQPYFGTGPDLVMNDFAAAATLGPIGAITQSAPGSYWWQGSLWGPGLAQVNRYGLTQFRLRFFVHDDGDDLADYIGFYTGDMTSTYRPQLLVYYNP